MRTLVGIIRAGALAAALVGLHSLVHAMPTPAQVRAAHMPSDTLVLSREGEVLHRLRTDFQVRRGQWVALADISPALQLALLASEDRRFYEHSGVDWQAVSAAAWGNLWNTRTRGASTITMQLAGLLDDGWRGGTRRGEQRRSLGQKLGQAVTATRLERGWRKDEILETYLNLVPWRGELVGIDALSRTLFGKAAHGLDAAESAIAAALVRGPNADAATVARRACAVAQDVARLQAMRHARPPTSALQVDNATKPTHLTPPPHALCEALRLRTPLVLGSRLWSADEGIAPHWARRVHQQVQQQMQPPVNQPASADRSTGSTTASTHTTANTHATATAPATGQAPSSRIRTTLRADVQRLALDSLQRHLRELHGRHVEDGAVLVLDNASGEVLAWVGSSGPLSQAPEVDAVLALRQPGSTLKPFLYAQAIAQRRLTAASLVQDSAAHIATGTGLYIPQNYDRRFKGWVSVRLALAASLNVPAVRTLVMVTPEKFVQQLRDLGLTFPHPAGYYGYSLALGSAEVSLLHLTNAYRALANAGRWQPVAPAIVPARGSTPKPPPSTPTPRQAIPAPVAYIIGHILSDPQARTPTFGPDSVLTTRFWSAVKTGTSKDMRDNWAIGWSNRYTVGVWVGNASGRAMHHVSGSSGAAPVWAHIMAYLHAHTPSTAPRPPHGVVQHPVRFTPPSGHPGPPSGGQWPESARQEWFLTGTQQTDFYLPTLGHPDTASTTPPATTGAGARTGTATGITAPAPAARILHPAHGTIIALDPDIPPRHQRLRLQANLPDVRWRALTPNGPMHLGRGQTITWLPQPGTQRLQLLDAHGHILDDISLQVRGAGLAR